MEPLSAQLRRLLGSKPMRVAKLGFDRRRRLNVMMRPVPREVLERLLAGGFSVEDVRASGFPVFLYKTQLTLHGLFPPDLDTRQAGYQALIRNKNGSLGIRWVAVDHKKKELLLRAASFRRTAWEVYVDSRGLHAYRIMPDPGAASRCLTDVGANAGIIGVARVLHSHVLGLWAVVVEIYAIPAPTLDACMRFFTGIGSPSELEALEAEARRCAAIERAKARLAQARAEAEAKARHDAWVREVCTTYNLRVVTPADDGHYLRIVSGRDRARVFLHVHVRARAGHLVYRAEYFDDFDHARAAVLARTPITRGPAKLVTELMTFFVP